MSREVEYKKQDALLLLSFSYLFQMKERAGLNIDIKECKTKYDHIAYKIYKWLDDNIKNYVSIKVKNYVDMRMNEMYKKYYSDGNTPGEDIMNVGMFFFYLFLDLTKDSKHKKHKPPVTIEEVKEFLDWYNDGKSINQEAALFMYRAAMAIYPDKKSTIVLRNALGRLYVNVSLEELQKGE